MFVGLLFLSFFCDLCGGDDLLQSKYVVVDGIKVLREDYEAFAKAENNLKRRKSTIEEGDWLQREVQLEKEESPEYSMRFPKRCHVCKLFVEELENIMNNNFTRDAQGFFQIKTLTFYDALEETCQNMRLYTVTRANQFRYMKGESLLRMTFNQAQRDSKIKTWSYTLPNENIDDPTGEIQRLRKKCEILVDYHDEKNLLRWLKQHQNVPLHKWFCQDIYLKNNKQGIHLKTSLKTKLQFQTKSEDLSWLGSLGFTLDNVSKDAFPIIGQSGMILFHYL